MALPARLLRPRASVSLNFDPRAIANCALWLDASNDSSLTFNGNTVSEWRDLSGNGRHFSQATAAQQPNGTARTQNGRRVLDYAGGQGLNGNAAALKLARNVVGVTIAAVCKTDESLLSAGINRVFLTLTSGTSGVSSRVFFAQRNASGSGQSIGNLVVAGRRLDADSFQERGFTANNDVNVLTGIWNYGSATSQIFENGTSRSSGAFQTAGNSSDTDSQHAGIGAASDLSSALDGFVAELIFYQRVLLAAERQTLERYLGAKWGITVA